jgi:hypothetical protein
MASEPPVAFDLCGGPILSVISECTSGAAGTNGTWAVRTSEAWYAVGREGHAKQAMTAADVGAVVPNTRSMDVAA